MAGPSSETRDYGALLTTTLEHYRPRLRDNISRGSKVYAWMDANGRVKKVDGGERVRVDLMYGLNSTADIFSGYGTLDTTPQDGMTVAFYDWAQIAVAITMSGREMRQNSGTARILNLQESKIMQAENSAKELLNNCLVGGRITSSSSLGRFFARQGRMDSSAQGPLPLAALIDANASRSVSIGNINGNTYSWWRNVAASSTGATYAAVRREMTNVYNSCSKGVMGNPDLMISDQVAWELYWAGLEGKEQYVVNDAKVIDILGGTDALRFRGATYVWDEVVPDVETNAEVVDAVGTVTTSNVFFLNSDSYEIIVDKETDFTTTPMIRTVGQDAMVAEILWMGATAVNNRRKNGVLYGISQSIAS